MDHSHLVQNALKFMMEELKLNPQRNFMALCDEAGARFNLSPLEVNSLGRIFKEEYEDNQ